MGTSLSAQDAELRKFWRELCPWMSIEGDGTPAFAGLGDPGALIPDLNREGYVQVPGVFSESSIVPLRSAIATLAERKIPLPFAFVYDELWLMFQGLASFLSTVLGEDYRALPDFWVWHLYPNDMSTGWGPHRDRTIPTLGPDNSPHSLTVWLPFTDATPLNGCMYVLPAHLDERFQMRRWDGPSNTAVPNPQNIRALPATAGSVLAWNQAVLHWGGRASRLGTGPRISAAFEFQRGDHVPFNQPLLDPGRVPPFTERLGLIGKQVLQYRHMYPLSDEVAAIATSLFERYMPGGGPLPTAPTATPRFDDPPAPTQERPPRVYASSAADRLISLGW
ncbi:phytanoyl-CoA dioxygenase family protein [Mycobacterium intermedium]|uniref:phytanoyl-CoA dioxygenase family protein n=1 Tax=Mycobacterium intermedium TaxID=28445 RepID=UPI001E3DBAA0|nr:phytanoyl-CoA dioxygenase family protein [Mycobacterium intermedium]